MPSSTLVRPLIGLVLLLAAATTMAAEWNVAELMRTLAQTKEGRASFVEKKYIGIVDKPLVSSGELAFTSPDRLEKRTIKPVPESLVLEGDSLTIEQADRRRLKVRLQDYPEVAAFVESIRGTLAGDRLALERAYTLELTGSVDKWQLVLTPMHAQMAKLITRIRISGALGEVRTISFEQADGDRSDMAITKVLAK
ncbi:LolA-related protein [Rhodoferax sp.]|uniref:LolA-related protein n=1 Tax=Rhodoferax sp. TaxID=50421 RepID=UPI002777AFBA|nr:LolA-related protein [Rhodoferax sp.]